MAARVARSIRWLRKVRDLRNSVEPGVAHGGQGIVDGRLSGALLGDLLVSVLDSADDCWSKHEEDKIDRAETTTPEKKPRPGYFV